MKKIVAGLIVIFVFLLTLSFKSNSFLSADEPNIDSLRKIYSGPKSKWPKPNIDSGVKFEELSTLLPSPFIIKNDSVKRIVDLGKLLFFDPRLSSSNQISCASCHAPDLNWSDGRETSIGHDHASGLRNAPSLENVWYFKKLFWDGRANSLEEQIAGPITSAVEMRQNMKSLAQKIGKIKGYRPIFKNAFGTEKISNEFILKALADFQRTIVSRTSDFDRFLSGNKNSLTNQQVLGLHLFRTKARCVNCHFGPMFTDNDFHNNGLTYYKRKYEDLGLYYVTKKPQDAGKFKTPGLRNVMRTAPWFHNGLFADINGVMNMYNAGMPTQRVRPEQLNDPLLPKNDRLLKRLALNKAEKDAIIAFLHSLSAIAWKQRQPELPN